MNYDMEEFEDAKDDIDSILTREPNHANAKILLGKVQLKRQKLMEATEVELGSTSQQKSIVPGEKLKVTLSGLTPATRRHSSCVSLAIRKPSSVVSWKPLSGLLHPVTNRFR